jgi:hypothetical protein
MNTKSCPDGKELNPKTNRCNKQLPLAERDLYLLQIETEIRNKRKLLIKKKKDLDQKHKLNHYLNDVKQNYSKYYDYILKEKQQQYNALILLKEYMNDLLKTEDLVDDQLRIAKHDQKDIIREIDKVKTELDELIE